MARPPFCFHNITVTIVLRIDLKNQEWKQRDQLGVYCNNRLPNICYCPISVSTTTLLSRVLFLLLSSEEGKVKANIKCHHNKLKWGEKDSENYIASLNQVHGSKQFISINGS